MYICTWVFIYVYVSYAISVNADADGCMVRFRASETVVYTARARLKCVNLALGFGRDEATRTPDPYVPNVVRYQLRYIPICAFAAAKIQLFSE